MLVMLMVAALRACAVWLLWQDFMARPWTRDGAVRAYVVTLAQRAAAILRHETAMAEHVSYCLSAGNPLQPVRSSRPEHSSLTLAGP